MPLGEKQLSVSQIQYQLYNRPLHPELFDIYHDHPIAMGPYEARIWITGISHVVGFFYGQGAIVELLAEEDELLPRRGRLVTMSVRGEKTHQATHVEGIRYMTSFQVERMSPRLFTRTHEELLEHGSHNGLFVPFPEWASGPLIPFTQIDYDAKADMLHVFGYHCFPEELTVIKTQSIFELT